MAEARLVSSIRFRMAVLYTVVVFSIAALVVGVINLAFSRSLGAEPVTAELLIRRISSEPGAAVFLDAESLDAIEQLANQRALEELRAMSLLVLAILVPTSLVAGWFISGSARMLLERPSSLHRVISLSSERATNKTFRPRAANLRAKTSPMPEDAPVIRVVFIVQIYR